MILGKRLEKKGLKIIFFKQIIFMSNTYRGIFEIVSDMCCYSVKKEVLKKIIMLNLEKIK